MTRRGRRPTFDEPATAHLNIRVTPGQRLELRRVAAENGMRVSAVVRDAVNEFVADYREGGRVFRRRAR